MKYLFIVMESESANGICTGAVMKQLSAEHEVYCITNREWGAPERFERDGVTYLTVRPRTVYRITSMLARKELPEREKNWWQRLRYVMDRSKLLLTLGIWPLISPAYSHRIYKMAAALCEKERIDCIVPVYTQIDTLIAAERIKRRNKDIFYIPYFLDSLSGGYGLRLFTREQTRERGLRWERRLLPAADWIIAMESSREHHEKYSISESYYNRILYFDLPLLYSGTPEPGDRLMDPDKCNLVYVGTLPRGIRSPEYILNVFRQLQGEQYQIYFVGTSDCEMLNEAAALDSRIHVVGRCPHEKALQYEKQADILLNIGNSNPNMTPSKIFEYMSFGKPIISTMAVEQEPSRRYLERYPLALVLDESEQNYGRAARLVSDFAAESENCAIDPAQIRKTFYPNTPDAMASFLKKLSRSPLE